jgi:hypothetical protein
MTTTYAKLEILSIDAWREREGGWTWNNAFRLESDIWLEESRLTPRKILSFLRRAGYLSDASKGKVRVEELPTFEPMYEIQLASTGEPLFALQGEWRKTRD